MSKHYELADLTLWNPSNGRSEDFLSEVRRFERELAEPSGIGPEKGDDAYEINPIQLARFVRCVLTRPDLVQDGVPTALLPEGVVVYLLALLENAQGLGDVTRSFPRAARHAENARVLAKNLPR